MGPDDPPSGPQRAGPWPLAWHPLWAALGGQGRPLLTQAAHRARPTALRASALSELCVCLGEGTPWNVPSWWSVALSRAVGARLGPLGSGGEGPWEAGQVECAEGGGLWCPTCVSGGVQGLLLAEPAPSQLLTTQAAGPLGTHPGPGPSWMGHRWSLEGALGSHRGTGVGSGEQEGLIRGHPATARPLPSGSGAGTPQRPPHPPEDPQGLQAVGRVGPDLQQPRVSPAEGLL